MTNSMDNYDYWDALVIALGWKLIEFDEKNKAIYINTENKKVTLNSKQRDKLVNILS